MDRERFLADTVEKLLAQGGFAINWNAGVRGSCRYRTSDGKKCAIGVHIPDELYRETMEGSGVLTLFLRHPEVQQAMEAVYGKISSGDIADFLNFVQRYVHDIPATNGRKPLTLEEAKEVLFR